MHDLGLFGDGLLLATQCSKEQRTNMTTGNHRARILPAASRADRPSMTAMQTIVFAGIARRKIWPQSVCEVSSVKL